MTKADSETTTWILLRDGKALVTEIYQASQLAERLLRQWLADGQVRWRGSFTEGRKRRAYPDIGEPAFWMEMEPGSNQILLHVNWSESWTRRGGIGGCTVYRIEVAREDVIKMLPALTTTAVNQRSVSPVSTKTWITAEAQRMRDANEVPATKTAFAQMLGDRMAQAHAQGHNIHVVGWRHILNQLEDEWSLWPVTLIPLT